MCQHAEIVRLPLAGHLVVIAGTAYTMCCNTQCSLPMVFNPYIYVGARWPFCVYCSTVFRNQQIEEIDSMGLLSQFQGHPWLCAVCAVECKTPAAIFLHAGGVVTCKRHHHPAPAQQIKRVMDEFTTDSNSATWPLAYRTQVRETCDEVYREAWKSMKARQRHARRFGVAARKRVVKRMNHNRRR